jgi:hypothetical protein
MLSKQLGLGLLFLYVCALGSVAFISGLNNKEGFFSSFQEDWNRFADLIIVSAHYTENLEWLKRSEYPVVICSKETSKGHAIRPNRKCNLPNKGREAASYIKFILAFYDDLPRRVAFIHGHDIAWHQSLDMLSAIRCADRRKKYVSLSNTFFDDRNMNNKHFRELKKNWDLHFKPFLNKQLPDRAFHDCCAQFVVSREAIRTIPRKAWKYWLDLLLTADDDYSQGAQFEFIWHYIFGEEAILPIEPSEYVKNNFTCTPEPATRIPPMPPGFSPYPLTPSS